MELGHLLTLSGLTYPGVSSKVCHDSFCQLEDSVSLPWVVYYEKESWQTFEETSGYVRTERVNKWPNSVTDI